MQVYLNGRFIPEDRASVSIHDRGFLYGDGLSETIRVYGGQPFLWEEHLSRLAHGCESLRIVPPFTAGEMRRIVNELLHRNALIDCIVRLTLSRGTGARGYSPKGADRPTFCIAPFPVRENLPATWKVISSSVRLPKNDPLSLFKHCNKLRQVVARAEADERGANEALLLNERGDVVEGTTTNLFWIERETVCTPPVAGILPGTTRGYILKLCAALGIPVREKNISLKNLVKTEGVFLTSSGIEMIEAAEIDGLPIRRSPVASRVKQNYRKVAIR